MHKAQHAACRRGIVYRRTKHDAVGLFHQRQNINDWPAEYAVSGFGAAAAAPAAAGAGLVAYSARRTALETDTANEANSDEPR